MPTKDPESTIGVGGRAMFWEGVFSTTSSGPQDATNTDKDERPSEESRSDYDHREVRPTKGQGITDP